MKKIAITGLSGYIGGHLAPFLPNDATIIDLYHTHPYTGKGNVSAHIHTDLSDQRSLLKTLDALTPDVIIHIAGITHIDKCESDKKNGERGIVWRVNAESSHTIATYCATHQKQLIFLSSECVFDGNQKSFTETSPKRPKNWYGITKHAAEKYIVASGAPYTIIRSVMVYHQSDDGATLFGQFFMRMKHHKNILAVCDQWCTPTYVCDITHAINQCVSHHITGIYHVSPTTCLTPYKFALHIANRYGFSTSAIEKTTLNSFFGKKQSTLRLRHACLSGTWSNKRLHMMPKNLSDVLNSK